MTQEKRKGSGRKSGVPNKSTLDQKAMQDYYVEQGYKSISEIAFLMANELYSEMDEVREDMGITSPEYDLAVKRANSAVKTAIPFFTTQIKALVLTDDESFSEESIAAKAKDILAKFKR